MRVMRFLLVLLLFSAPLEARWWKVQTSGIDTNLRGVSVAPASSAKGVSAWVVWASGSNGVILKSTDEGETWKRLHVTGGEALDFRGIVAFNATTAYVMSSGEGEKSRIYKTTDGGETWNLQYTDKRKEFFLDSIACLSETRCFALGDPIDGKSLLLNTTEGERWNPLSNDNMPGALPGEGAFAASNTCLLLSGEDIFFGTGGPVARVFRSPDSGRTWTVSETPIAHGNASSGIFSIARADEKTIVVVGGDYQDSKRGSGVAAYSRDQSKTWQLAPQQPGGYRSAVAHIDDGRWVAVGPNGEDVSGDFGVHWKHTDSLNLNAVAIADIEHGWAVGPNGTLARFVNHPGYEIPSRQPHGSSSPQRPQPPPLPTKPKRCSLPRCSGLAVNHFPFHATRNGRQ
ncbi:MAG: glycosyl hydrolase [Acidobacteria bacterium]|nr:MAG: glycosyl hydrolase [Acidobacteriota bacterium]